MTEDNYPRVSSSESTESSSTTKQRKKRKWDQPAELFVSAGVAVPGILPPLANLGTHIGIPLPGVAPLPAVYVTNPVVVPPGAILPPALQMPLQQHAAALVQKLNQPKMQDELIAKEIVINDADSAVRYKLTKRQTQEEIQKCTGAVVITRGKYRPPNAPPDGEKPLYLHISAGSHLETTVDRIRAVDRAAAMVEEMLKQGSDETKANQSLSTCVFLGFEADPSLNIVARIRGPNDQYVNHIMNETGATVVLRGRGSGNPEGVLGEDEHQPLHLFLSSNNSKSLEHAKLLAENLLDTISAEFGAPRVSSSKVYGAVPPPPQLSGVGNSRCEPEANVLLTSSLTVSTITPQVTVTPSVALLPPISVVPQTGVSQTAGLLVPSQSPCVNPSLNGGTSYAGYGGIYPQATPLQQVALALRQSTAPATAMVSPTTSANTAPRTSSGLSSEKEKRATQRRKFQELPATVKGPTHSHQGAELPNPRELTTDAGARDISEIPAPRKLVQPSLNKMPPPPPRSIPPPPKLGSATLNTHDDRNLRQPSNKMQPPPPKIVPPPPKFVVPATNMHGDNNSPKKLKPESVPDTLIKLMEYGEDDDDDDTEETIDEHVKSHSRAPKVGKPFWAA